MIPARQPHPQRCRKLFVNCDNVLSCIAPFADDITNEKCIEGKGECEFREVKATHTSPQAPASDDVASTDAMERRKSRLDPDGSTGAPEREESRHTCTNLNEHDAQVAKAARGAQEEQE